MSLTRFHVRKGTGRGIEVLNRTSAEVVLLQRKRHLLLDSYVYRSVLGTKADMTAAIESFTSTSTFELEDFEDDCLASQLSSHVRFPDQIRFGARVPTCGVKMLCVRG